MDASKEIAITDRQKMLIAEGFRRLQDRVSRASEAEYDVAHDMLAKVIVEAKNLRKTLIKAKKD